MFHVEFVTEFYKMMLRLIERGAKRVASSELNLLKYELQGHLWILKEAADWFCGKEEEVETIRRYITGLSTASFVLYGPPGSGKTYLVARVVQQVRSSVNHQSGHRFRLERRDIYIREIYMAEM